MIGWWQRRTLRVRLAAWYAVGGTVLLAAFSMTVYSYVEYRVALPLDHELRRDLEQVRNSIRVTDDRKVLWDGQEERAGVSWPSSNPWFELWDENGNLVRRAWPFVDSRLEHVPLPPPAGRETISVFNVASDIRLRALSLPLKTGGVSDEWMVRVMALHEPAVNALGALVLIIAAALPVVIILLVLGGYLITRRWLRPLGLIAREAELITASDLSRRLPVGNPHDELGKLAIVFNQTLSRLEDSFLTLDRFVADASHELLTPLTTLRSVGEVGLRSMRGPEEYREIIGSMLEEAQRIQLLMEKLLQLARAEGGTDMVKMEPVKLEALARECAEDASILADEKYQSISLDLQQGETLTDPLLLRQALQNLVDNAIKYSPKGARVGIMVADRGSWWELAVSDEGPGVPVEHRVRLGNRFYRADKARGRAGGGYGLGLAITKAYMRVLGGELEYQALEPHGSRFILKVPQNRVSPSPVDEYIS